MIKTITRIGNSKGIILDAALLELAHLKEGDQLSVTIHEGGTILFSPLEPRLFADDDFDQATKEVITDYEVTLRKLS